jgi:hypothetical protein
MPEEQHGIAGVKNFSYPDYLVAGVEMIPKALVLEGKNSNPLILIETLRSSLPTTIGRR